MNMSTSESKQPKSVCIILEDESFEDDINHISEGSGIYVEKDNRGQLLKNLPFCSSINGWLKLYVDMDCMYVRMLNELTLSKRKVVIALRNEFRKVLPCGRTVAEKLEMGVTIGNSGTNQVILINPEVLSRRILLHELIHAWRNITGQTLADVLTDEKETNKIQNAIEREMERIL